MTSRHVQAGAGTGRNDRVDRNASLASADVVAYTATLVAELAQRYPSVAGFRLDWPEYPPYDLVSALFDFNRAATQRMAAAGAEPRDVARRLEGQVGRAVADRAEALLRARQHPFLPLAGPSGSTACSADAAATPRWT